MLYKVTCTRCANGLGVISAYKHVRGGACFKCGGRGHTTSKRSQDARDKAKAKAKARRDEATAIRQARHIANRLALIAAYSGDARIGPQTRDWISRHDDAGIYGHLSALDAGKYTGNAAQLLVNIAV